jgi:uncharacterized protein (TIGR02001 family)
MKTYLTLSAIALAAAATLSSGTVLAQAAAPADIPSVSITPNIGITSDYRFRGLSQNNKNPALQGGLDIAFKEGFYLGIWASQVSDWAAGPKGDNLEVDFYGGYKKEISGITFDVGAIAYHYPGSKKGASDNSNYLANTEEVYVGVTYGPALFKVNYVIGDNYFASTAPNKSARGTTYYDLTLTQEVAPKLSVVAHAGYTDYKESASGYTDAGKFSYADYFVGLSYDMNGVIISGKYHTNDMSAGAKAYATSGTKALYKDAFVVSLTKAF